MDDLAALTSVAHRSIRRLDAQECAFAGELVADGDVVRVRVDAERMPEALWTFADAEHVVGVRDVVRTPIGHDVLVPWCTDPLEMFLGRRTAAEQPLSPGETVTLVGSLLRGIVEVGDADLRGKWWLADDARPTFAVGEGSACSDAAVQIIQRVRDGCEDRLLDRLLGEIATGAGDPRTVRRSIEAWERELTELAAPRALERDVFPAERASSLALHRQRATREVAVDSEQHAALRSVQVALRGVVARVLAGVGSIMERAHRPRVPRPEGRTRDGRPEGSGGAAEAVRPRRGRLALVGAVAAAVVLGAGMLWPTDAEDSAAVEQPAPSAMPSDPVPSEPTPPQSAEPTPRPSDSAAEHRTRKPPAADSGASEANPEQSARALLKAMSGCLDAADGDCAEAIVAGSAEVVLKRLKGADPERRVSPVEDYGDIAVLRLGAVGAVGEQMLVLVRQKDGWLVRDVYDIADQPSEGE